MSKYKTVHIDSERLNPQFVGITEKYSQKKKKRQQTETKKRYVENSFNHLEKMNENITGNLNKKKHELNYLKSVRQRYLEDMRNKMMQDQKNRLKLQQLRSRSDNARKTHHRNLIDAIQSKYRQKKKSHDKICQQLNQLKRYKQQKQAQQEQFFELRQKQIEQDKMMGRSKVNKFFRHKNKLLLTSYRQMIQKQEYKTKKSTQKIQFFETKTQIMKNKMSKKQKQLQCIENQIQKYKITSMELKDSNLRNQNYLSRISGISKMSFKSSKPEQILLNSISIEKSTHPKKSNKKKNRLSKSFMLTENSNTIQYKKSQQNLQQAKTVEIQKQQSSQQLQVSQ